jgi:DNA-directed RNA polymerase specialized sigma24 family protein
MNDFGGPPSPLNANSTAIGTSTSTSTPTSTPTSTSTPTPTPTPTPTSTSRAISPSNPSSSQSNSEIVSTLSDFARLTGGKESPAMSACLALSSLEPHAKFVSAPETRAAIQSRLLSRGVRREDVEDETQNVLAKLYLADPTQTLEDRIGLGRHIASQHAVDCLRRHSRRGKHNVGLTEDADDHAQDDHAAASLLDSIDRKRQLRVFEEEVVAGRITERQVAVIAQVADGYNDVEIARSLRMTNQTVRNALSLTRKISRSAWAKHVGTLGALGIAILFIYWLRDRREEAKI